MAQLLKWLKQCYFISAPPLTEHNLPDQDGKVHIVTGGYAGVGHELVNILYARNATVYSAGRSLEKGRKSIESIKAAHPESKGKLEFLFLDLSDQSTIKKSAEGFMSKEQRLDVLTNNAGVMTPPKGSKDAHGHELRMGTNCIGPWLFTQCLLPVLKKTAASSPAGSVRVTWAGSLATDLSPKGGVTIEDDGSAKVHDTPGTDYGQTKAGNYFLATETARRYGKDGIVSVAWNPGNLRSELQRHMSLGAIGAWIFDKTLLYPPVMGAYTELYAACSQDITPAQNGCFVVPWGRIEVLRPDVVAGSKTPSEGGTGQAEKFWEWCEKETVQFA